MTTRPALLPDYTTPAKLAEHFGVSERTLREKLREIGAFAMLGRTVVLFPEHVEALKEAMKCRSNYSGETASGISEGPLPEGSFTSLQKRLTEKSRNGSKRKPKPKRGNVVSMDPGRG
ncbi:hypothetical protein [Salipiger abyssi]|uniref:hypothetical protein n=1 Tax=Salipiger abyssi TaxID=1250539 RepID=UPI0018DDE1E7|nr:hypothetical protein [Salipiger abyssi]